MHIVLIGGRDVRFSSFFGLDCTFSIIQTSDSLGVNQEKLSDRIVLVDSFGLDTVADVVIKLHATQKIDYIYSFFEESLLAAAYAAKVTGIAGPSYDACLLCVDKARMRERLNGTRFATRFELCYTVSEAIAFHQRIDGPIVLKETCGTGSTNVFVCAQKSDIIAAWHACQAAGTKELIVEEYLTGEEYSLETLSLNGRHEFLGATKKYLYEDTLVERHHIFPAPDVDDARKIKLAAFCSELLNFIGFEHGPCHIEVKIAGDAIRLIEINNRAGGDSIWKMVEQVTGVDLIRESVVHAFAADKVQIDRGNLKKHSMMVSRALFGLVDVDTLRPRLEQDFKVAELTCKAPKIQNVRISSSFDRFGFVVVGDIPTVPFLQAFNELDREIVQLERHSTVSYGTYDSGETCAHGEK
jgi:hypothetical protein